MYNLLQRMTVGGPLQDMTRQMYQGGPAATILGLAVINTVAFGMGSLMAPLPYIIASAASKTGKYSRYKFWLGILSALLNSGFIGLPGSVFGTFWMMGKLEKHLSWQKK